MRNKITSLLLALTAAASSFAAGQIIELKNGTKLVGTIEKHEGGKVYINADLVGSIVIDESALAPAGKSETAEVPKPETHQPMPVVQAPPPAAPKSQAGKVIWKRMFSVNGSYNSAAYVQGSIPGSDPKGHAPKGAEVGLQGKQSTVQLSGLLARVSPTDAMTLNGSYGYAKYEPSPSAVINNWSGEFTYTHVLTPQTYTLARSTYKVDKVALIDHSFEQVLGYGYKVFNDEQTKLDLIPGISALNETKGTKYDGDWILSVGFLEHLEYAFNERVSLEQKFKYRVGVEHTSVWAIDSYIGFKAAITEHVSFTTGVTYTYDNTLGPLPATLVPTFQAFQVPQAEINQLRPAKKGLLQTTAGITYDW